MATKRKPKEKVTYHYGTGRRKRAAARVFICPGEGVFTVNHRPLEQFFSRLRSQIIARQALQITNNDTAFDLKVTVRGGGENGQAEAVRHGIARALVQFNPELKTELRAAGLITRDSRSVERKKVGLRKARRSRQYSKR